MGVVLFVLKVQRACWLALYWCMYCAYWKVVVQKDFRRRIFFNSVSIHSDLCLFQLLIANMDEQRDHAHVSHWSAKQSAEKNDMSSSLDCSSMNKKLDEILEILRSNNGGRKEVNSVKRPLVPRSPIRSTQKARSRSSGQSILQDLQMLATVQASWRSQPEVEIQTHLQDSPSYGSNADMHIQLQDPPDSNGIYVSNPLETWCHPILPFESEKVMENLLQQCSWPRNDFV